MLSLPKILALAVVIVVVWFGFRLLDRRVKGASSDDDTAQSDKTDKKKAGAALDLEECGSCGAWIVEDQECPYCK